MNYYPLSIYSVRVCWGNRLVNIIKHHHIDHTDETNLQNKSPQQGLTIIDLKPRLLIVQRRPRPREVDIKRLSNESCQKIFTLYTKLQLFYVSWDKNEIHMFEMLSASFLKKKVEGYCFFCILVSAAMGVRRKALRSLYYWSFFMQNFHLCSYATVWANISR